MVDLVVVSLAEKSMKKTAIATTLLCTVSFASAAPVYLNCVTTVDNPSPGGTHEFRFSVKLDEASGNVTHTDADGAAFNTRGFFSPTEVGYKQNVSTTNTFDEEVAYQIDRTNLAVIRTQTTRLSESGMESLQKADDSKSVWVTRGLCKIADVKNRKF